MSDKEQAELWESVAKAFDDTLTEIREIAEESLSGGIDGPDALRMIVRLIGEPTYQDAEQ